MEKKINIPRTKMSSKNSALTIYLDSQTIELYRIGKQNGWDMSEIMRRAVREALVENAKYLHESAEKFG